MSAFRAWSDVLLLSLIHTLLKFFFLYVNIKHMVYMLLMVNATELLSIYSYCVILGWRHVYTLTFFQKNVKKNGWTSS